MPPQTGACCRHPPALSEVWTAWHLRLALSGLGMPKEQTYPWMRDWLVSADSWKQEASQGEINVLLDWSITVRNQAGV